MPVENFEDLSDVELHRKLLEYGFPNVPVTETSRNILVKKLNNHVKNMRNRTRWQKANDVSYPSKLRIQPGTTNLMAHQHSRQQLQDELYDLQNVQQNTNSNSGLEIVTETEPAGADNAAAQLAEDSQVAPQTTLPSRGRSRLQPVQRDDNLASDEERCGVITLILRVFGLQENSTNFVWWGFTLFFAIITFLYVVNITDRSKTINEQNTHYILCGRPDPAGALTRPAYICIDQERLLPALVIVRELLQLLHTRAERHFCHDRQYPRLVSVSEFMRHIFEKGSSADLRNMESAQYLITCNPQWRIEMVNAAGTPVIFNGVDKILPNHRTYFVLLRPQLPLLCTLNNKLQRFLDMMSQFTLLICILMIACLAYCYVRRMQEQRLQDVENYLIAIVGELRRRATMNSAAETRLVLINHLRDELIPLRKRASTFSSWNEALRVLEENDSRIRFGVTTRNGEEFRTMEWIGDKELTIEDAPNEVDTHC